SLAPAHISGQINADFSGTVTIQYTDGLQPDQVTLSFPAASPPVPPPSGTELILGNANCSSGPDYFDKVSISSDSGGGGSDTTPPTLTVSNLAVDATSPSGATVSSYPVSASDDTDPNPSISCSPAAPHLFAIGDSSVDCTAQDASGNTS